MYKRFGPTQLNSRGRLHFPQTNFALMWRETNVIMKNV